MSNQVVNINFLFLVWKTSEFKTRESFKFQSFRRFFLRIVVLIRLKQMETSVLKFETRLSNLLNLQLIGRAFGYDVAQ